MHQPRIFSLLQVERRSANNLTVEDFYSNYERTSTPVIITDQQVTTEPWTLEHVKEKAGYLRLTCKLYHGTKDYKVGICSFSSKHAALSSKQRWVDSKS